MIEEAVKRATNRHVCLDQRDATLYSPRGQYGERRGSSEESRISPRSQRSQRGNHLPGGRGGTRTLV